MSDEPAGLKEARKQVRKERTKAEAPPPPKKIPALRHHALFRPPQGTDMAPEAFERIYVARHIANGELEEAIEWFTPDTLQDLSDVQQRFGGGVYQLTAIRHDGTLYRSVRTNRLPGPSKPLVPSFEEPQAAAPAPVAQAVAPPPHSSDMTVVMAMMQMMMQESRASAERVARMQSDSNQQMMAMHSANTQILVAALSGNKVDPASLVSSTLSAFAQIAKPSPAAPAPSMAEAIAEAKKVAELVTPPAKEESVKEIVGAVAEGIGALAMVQGAAAQLKAANPPQPAQSPLPPQGQG